MAQNKAIIEVISLTPSPYQYGDIVDLVGPPDDRSVRGLSAVGQHETLWFDFAETKTPAEREGLILALQPYLVRHDASDDRLAVVVQAASRKAMRRRLRGAEARGWGRLVPESRWKWPLSRSGQILNQVALAGVVPLLTAPLAFVMGPESGIVMALGAVAVILSQVTLLIGALILMDASRAPGWKGFWIGYGALLIALFGAFLFAIGVS